MSTTPKATFPLWKAFWVVCPAMGLAAIVLCVLNNFITDQLIDKHATLPHDVSVLKYYTYNSFVNLGIVLLQALACAAVILRYRNNTTRSWFKAFAIATILGYAAYFAYQRVSFVPDSHERPINDHFS
jgi:hypothetical protein